MTTPDRVVKTKAPLRVIMGAVLIALFVIGFIWIAIWYTGAGIMEARMRGTIVSKEFRPFKQTEHQITLNRNGMLDAQDVEGQYILTVEVTQKDGTKKTFTVWLEDKKRYDAVKVGDPFDVGPYLVPSK